MSSISQLQGILLFLLGVAAFGLELYALLDAIRHRPDAYVAAGKQTKQLWVAILAVASVVGFVLMNNVINFIGVAGVAAAAIYLTSVRPALKQVSGGNNDGPYGPWR